MWTYSDAEFIKIFRKLLSWEWYTDVKTKTLFLHCLLKANWKDGTWHGYEYKRGQFITSLPSLAAETGLTVQEVRTALNHLKSTGELTDWHDNKIRIITVVSFDKFQKDNRQPNSPSTGNQQATNRQLTADIRSKEYKEDKNKRESTRARFTPPTLDDVSDYCQQRNNGIDPQRFIDFYSARGWRLSNKVPMADWKAAVRTWEQRDKAKQKEQANRWGNDPDQRKEYGGEIDWGC